MRRLGLVLALLALARLALPAAPNLQPTVILVSIDGWRWDYHTRIPATTLARLAARGVRADGLIPSFPTKTFPNHYTVVTGLYPGHHGIVSNNIRDPETGRLFSMSRREEVRDPMWWGGLPIWVSLERAGQRTAPLFWPGSEAAIQGVRPRYWREFDNDMSGRDRVQQLLRWLDRPAEDRPTFLTLYFSEVDSAGHGYGPESTEVRQAGVRVDRELGRLVNELERRQMLDQVNLLIVSDHGMAATSRRRVIYADDLVSPQDGIIVDVNPGLGVVPTKGREDAVFRRLASHPNLNVFRREETPAHWHYRNHPRIPPVVAVADEGWTVLARRRSEEGYWRTPQGIGGAHGYDPRVRSMHGLFVAAGPAFRQGVVVPAFENVHVYNALCAVLGIEAAKNDGDPAVARQVLR